MRDRDYRRAQRRLSIHRARERGILFGVRNDELWVRRSAAAPKDCSGPCCGNPRRWFGQETMQERRSASVDDWRYEHDE